VRKRSVCGRKRRRRGRMSGRRRSKRCRRERNRGSRGRKSAGKKPKKSNVSGKSLNFKDWTCTHIFMKSICATSY
jgi:hypothetical protein